MVDRIIRILIVDDHPMMREGLRSTLERERDMKVVGEASDGGDAIDQFRALRPTVTLIDLQMSPVDGVQAIAKIHEDFPEAPLIVLTTYPGDARVSRALRTGAMSYLLKTASSDEVVRTVRFAADGKKVVTPEVMEDISAHQGLEGLTPREVLVLRLVAQGMSNRVIGDHLRVSEDTIKTRMKSIMGKLDARDRAHAVTIAIRRGFLDPQ
ncbi:response regulator [Luteibacter yeojuensis]|uniref:Response regulator transcription factor n=1 Tax=Luteibacter yeojuensis TaxID=345309 RepID=A0A7X5QV58_9GAMM|nr:response regulator transcription factor [Luteibacter yeojuensis]NID16011.1 response regulator transcription factor [Luteibacter yeojuensis]